MSLSDVLQYLVITHLVHVSKQLQPVSGLNSNESLCEWNGTKPPIKKEQSFEEIDSQEPCHIEVVW